MLFAVATPMHMIAPINDGTFKVVCVTNNIQRMPASAPGSAVRMMNGSTQDWKLTAINRYTKTMAARRPRPSRWKEVCIVAAWPRRHQRAGLGDFRLRLAA